MADFVAVLKKTIDGMGATTPATRSRVYDKARSTIAAKLAAIDPPPAASVAERQKRALEDAIATVEQTYAAPTPAPASDPLAELENIFSSIERQRETRDKPPPQIDERIETLLASLEPEPAQDRLPTIPPSSTKKTKPVEPEINEGPNYQIRGGKLAGSISPPGGAEIELQKRLHAKLKRVVKDSTQLITGIKNRFPELANALQEYAELIEPETEDLDVVGLWVTGSALHSFSSAYREQNIIRTLSEPIEPQVEATMQAVARLHGAFIMGFEEGHDLVTKADSFMMNSDLLSTIREPGDKLITIFAENGDLVEKRTLLLNKPVKDYVYEFGWSGSRAGYAAYIIARNGILALLKALVGTDPSIIGTGSAAFTITQYANYKYPELAQVALPILFRNATQILAFFNHSPELRGYVGWALNALHEDQKRPTATP